MRILLYCQHVLGMGHLFRSLELVRAMAGHQVMLVTGGPQVALELPDNVRREQLPVLRMDEDFSALLPGKGDQRPLEEIKKERRTRLLHLVQTFRPHVFLVELYPFGRRAFGFELEPALQAAAKQGCRRVCSLRDILVEKRDQTKFEHRVLRLLNPGFDLLLVHSDPDVCSLERTFASMEYLAPDVVYTGYVAPDFSHQPQKLQVKELREELALRPEEKLLVASAGSGSVGGELLQACLEASALLAQKLPHKLCLFSGPLMEEERFQELEESAASLTHVRIRRFSQRFHTFLAAADLSVSMGGYNTVMALVAARTFGLVLPFAQNREQRMRAELLAQRGLLQVLAPQDLLPESLAEKLRQCLAPPVRPAVRVNLKGARATVRCLESLQAPVQSRGSVRREVCQPWQSLQGQETAHAFLAALQQRLAGSKGSKGRKGCKARIIFRADDVAVPGRQLQQLLELFLQHQTPLWPALVPAWLHEGHWAWLKQTSRNSSLFVWHQHGWRHANHEICGKKAEFGPARALACKQRDLQKGQDKLARLLGSSFTPVLTPPWNRMDADSLGLLPQLGYAGLSADCKLCELAAATVALEPLALLPMELDLHTRKEASGVAALQAMLDQCDQPLEQGRLGVMLHHQRMNAAAFDFLKAFLEGLPALGLEPVGAEAVRG